MPKAAHYSVSSPRTAAAVDHRPVAVAKAATRRMVKIGPLVLIACLIFAIFAVLMIPLVVGGAASVTSKAAVSEAVSASYTVYENSQDAAAALGLSGDVLSIIPQDAQVTAANVVDSNYLELAFTHEKSNYLFRVATGSDDLSGLDYDSVAYTAAEEGEGVTIGYAGVSEKKLNAAVWINGEHSYALVSNSGVEATSMKALVETMAAV